MNKQTQKLTNLDSFRTIWRDYQYPIINLNNDGITTWMASQDIKDELSLTYFEAVEDLVDDASKLDGLPFVLERTLQCIKLKKENRLGAKFCNLSRHPLYTNGVYDKINGYEASENFKVYESIARDLNLNRVNFTGDPRSEICPGVCEGELTNSLITRLQETTRRKSFKMKVDERKKESTQGFTKSKRYVERLYANSPCLYAVEMFVYYRSEHAKSITLEQSSNHIKKFWEPFETNSAIGSPVGWWWKREYMTETSYCYKLIHFFDLQKSPYNPLWLDAYGRHWASITNDEGAFVIPLVSRWDHPFSGPGSFHQDYRRSLDLLLSSIKLMLMRDIFLRLKRHKKISHFGMGELPKLLGGTSIISFTTSPPPILSETSDLT